jgi:hypothetical protein
VFGTNNESDGREEMDGNESRMESIVVTVSDICKYAEISYIV